ncbi:MAG: glycosyltransferase family 4 protein [Candidatus Vogelbacteria bacterium]|nr:glycosyltransferase family 4 protein [Candidatus Vogelbacteria bacterium]
MKICYINFNLNNPRDQITLRGLKENGVSLLEISDCTPGWRKYVTIAKSYRAHRKECDVVMIGYAGSVLVIFMSLITRKSIVYNSLANFLDSMIISRRNGSYLSLSTIWYYAVEFLAFHMASLSFLECQSQKDMVVRLFKVNHKKISVHFVGTDDKQFCFDSTVKKLKEFTVMFRGMFLPEAGADVVIRAAKELEHEGIRFRIIGRGLLQRKIEELIQKLKPNNVEFITERLPIEILRDKMLECHLSLGQLAKHPRVHTTIPHKAFESMAMKLPYLTGENKGVMEVLKDGQTCFVVPPGDHFGLARKILEISKQPEDLERISENAYRLYLREFTPKILARKIVEEIEFR